MKQLPLFFAFFLALCALVGQLFFFSSFPLFVFLPFLSLVFQKKSLLISLWLAFLCAALTDLLSSHTAYFGQLIWITLFSSFLTYHFKHYFFIEKLFSFPFYTMLFSLFFSTLEYFSFHSCYHPIFLLLMPCIDGAYAFFWFTCPIILYNKIRKKQNTLHEYN